MHLRKQALPRIVLLALSLAVLSSTFVPSNGHARKFSDAALIDGFNKTVFGSEFSSSRFSTSYIRKFRGPVKFYVKTNVVGNYGSRAQRFIRRLERKVVGLKTRLVSTEVQANFVVHIVRRRNYAKTVRTSVFKRSSAPVRGKCMVRSRFSRRGITHSDAVIVADEGDLLFRRCMTEEILQGLGPLNDNRSLRHSIFNDNSNFTSFQTFDRYILNMLYARELENGMSPAKASQVLPRVLKRIRTRF